MFACHEPGPYAYSEHCRSYITYGIQRNTREYEACFVIPLDNGGFVWIVPCMSHNVLRKVLICYVPWAGLLTHLCVERVIHAKSDSRSLNVRFPSSYLFLW